MSLQAQRMVWERARARDPLELLALIAIAEWADLDGRNAAPADRLLAARLRLPTIVALGDLRQRLERHGELFMDLSRDFDPPRVRYHLRCCYDPLYRASGRSQ
jgi:hypothetical protein